MIEIIPCFTMPELTEKCKKVTIPKVVIYADGSRWIDTENGYGFMYKNIPFFLQKAGNVWLYNIYGLTVGNPCMNTYTDHRKSVNDFEHLDWIVDAVKSQEYVPGMTVYEAAKLAFELNMCLPGVTQKHIDKYLRNTAEKRNTKTA